jgi:hypothetical protein
VLKGNLAGVLRLAQDNKRPSRPTTSGTKYCGLRGLQPTVFGVLADDYLIEFLKMRPSRPTLCGGHDAQADQPFKILSVDYINAG